jgi:hypothetical protein
MHLKSLLVGIALWTVSSSFISPFPIGKRGNLSFPYKKQGLTERQAAVHLLNRFTYGIKPGDIDKVLEQGLENWFDEQLNHPQNDDELALHLASYDALQMDNEKIVNHFIPIYELRKMVRDAGIFIADSNFEKPAYRSTIDSFMKKNDIRLPGEYQRQLINQKFLRAVYTKNQLNEVLTDFWYNHFNVSLSKNQCALNVLCFERDVIRPNVLGNFETLLIATAKSPAMLAYLDNNNSISYNNTLSKFELGKKVKQLVDNNANPMQDESVLKMIKQRKEQGLNENYARELMELHTLGVDGGYTQKDVTEVARIFTGWSTVPLLKSSDYRKNFDKYRQYNLQKLGFIIDGNFLYRANRHDDSSKTVLKVHYPANGGYDEGISLLKNLANHTATAHFICKKIATKFVADNPPASLVEKMATAYVKSNGNIKQVLITMVNAPDFWAETSVRKKIKTPFEYIVSSIRATNANLYLPFQLYSWCTNMGQKFYNYQAPTGFPDRSTYWVNTSSLLNRMNFGMAFTANKMPGIKLDSITLKQHYEPESVEAAIKSLSEFLLPEAYSTKNLERVSTLLTHNEVDAKIDAATKQHAMNPTENDEIVAHEKNMLPNPMIENKKMQQIVGLLIGSPEFQKR